MTRSPLPAGASELDRRMMQRALRAAARGRPSPNPHVGAVVARGEQVIAVGHHVRAGADHGEVAALKKAGDAARGATLYVSFEPCNHFGRTPPCTDAILAAGIARVVVGCADPAPHEPGSSAKLRAGGVEVVLGVEEHAAKRLIEDFARHFTTGLPYVRLKSAVTLDGRTADRSGKSKWITGELARRESHRLRAESDAVLVGVGTVLADDPSLTVRDVPGRDPIRVVLDADLRTPPSSSLFAPRKGARVILIHADDLESVDRSTPLDSDISTRLAALRGVKNVELVPVPRGPAGVDLDRALRELANRDVVRLLVEGGARVHGALLDADLVQRVTVFVAPALLGDPEAMPIARGKARSLVEALRLHDVTVERLGDDVMVDGYVDGA